ncbi:MAG TPA: GlsB/YeaQ/YmgE family stress response membrane protein [Polyangiaceae bacterium]|nr:GlsB/YeaQ/YmgE family stress response membrane protein [Polyangiaceae bacterium]
MHVLVFLLFGLVVGALARFIVPGREPGGWVVSMLLGVGGAVLGGYFGRLLGFYREGQPAGFFLALVGAVALVAVYHLAIVRRGRLT